jgi:superoxide dismutase, Fe-Mn family
MNRRTFLTAAAIAATTATGQFNARAQTKREAFKLAPLGYANDALEPHIDALTMQIHHDRHHQALVNNLNAALEKRPEFTASLEEMLRNPASVPEDIRTAVRNNAGGHWNHTFFWDLMTPGGSKEPVDSLKDAIVSTFGSLDTMKMKLATTGTGHFGSGWAWLIVNKDGKLEVISTTNQDTPLELGGKPVLGVDVWEHAYYLKYQNKRADYLSAWWNTVNWDKAQANLVR